MGSMTAVCPSGRVDGTDGRPASAGRVPDRAERRADAVVHRIGLAAGVAGAVGLLAAQEGGLVETGAVAIYAVGLLAMLGSSAAYNMARPSRIKWLLRRADHAAIFLMIAATYTPFLARLRDVGFAGGMAAFVWAGAIGGMILKLGWPGRFDRLSVALYLGLGWAIVAVAGPLAGSLATSTLVLLAAGGLLYTLGVPFHLWERLRFQTAIWHGFVLAAAGCHYAAVFDLMVLSA
ncbi:PAQR family membrane homeostasis protein TrhA [Alsobacter sp. R-9]